MHPAQGLKLGNNVLRIEVHVYAEYGPTVRHIDSSSFIALPGVPECVFQTDESSVF